MKPQSAASQSRESPTKVQAGSENLDGRYGKIGIPAVAAAVRYQSDAKNTAYAPVVPREENKRYFEASAA